ncbi:MAG: hypothetical protein JWO15_3534 [Sphingomonadales bacterium]|nr:hypothetical protein [Sphingomonadales bacterium]
MRSIYIIALLSFTFLGLGNAKAEYEVFVASLSEVQQGKVVSCVDIYADISPALAPAFRQNMKADGAVPNTHILSASSCSEKYPKLLSTEHCVYSMSPEDTKFTYKFQYYMQAGGTIKRNCLNIGGQYFRTVKLST